MKVEHSRETDECEKDMKAAESKKFRFGDDFRRLSPTLIEYVIPKRYCYCGRLRSAYENKISNLNMNSNDDLRKTNNLPNEVLELKKNAVYLTKKSLMLNQFLDLTEKKDERNRLRTTPTANNPANEFLLSDKRLALLKGPTTVNERSVCFSTSATTSVLLDKRLVNIFRSVALYWFFCVNTVLAKNDIIKRKTIAFDCGENALTSFDYNEFKLGISPAVSSFLENIDYDFLWHVILNALRENGNLQNRPAIKFEHFSKQIMGKSLSKQMMRVNASAKAMRQLEHLEQLIIGSSNFVIISAMMKRLNPAEKSECIAFVQRGVLQLLLQTVKIYSVRFYECGSTMAKDSEDAFFVRSGTRWYGIELKQEEVKHLLLGSPLKCSMTAKDVKIRVYPEISSHRIEDTDDKTETNSAGKPSFGASPEVENENEPKFKADSKKSNLDVFVCAVKLEDVIDPLRKVCVNFLDKQMCDIKWDNDDDNIVEGDPKYASEYGMWSSKDLFEGFRKQTQSAGQEATSARSAEITYETSAPREYSFSLFGAPKRELSKVVGQAPRQLNSLDFKEFDAWKTPDFVRCLPKITSNEVTSVHGARDKGEPVFVSLDRKHFFNHIEPYKEEIKDNGKYGEPKNVVKPAFEVATNYAGELDTNNQLYYTWGAFVPYLTIQMINEYESASFGRSD